MSRSCAKGLAHANGVRQQIKARRLEALTGYNTLINELDRSNSLMGLIANVHASKEVRAAAEDCERQIKKLASEITLDRGLYDVLAAGPQAEGDDQQDGRSP